MLSQAYKSDKNKETEWTTPFYKQSKKLQSFSRMKLKVLDVGCGLKPAGDVNIDLHFNEFTEHLDATERKLLTPRGVKNPVKADAHFLPFKNGIFDKVYSHHVLEHLDNPTKALSEMLRVANYKVIFVIPHRFNIEQKRALRKKIHKHVFTTRLVKRWLARMGITKYFLRVKYAPHPNKFLRVLRLLWLPSEIKVEIWK
jgi:ubiquinone/menaquinone biosynthesis C-methylase UbiE